MFTIFLIFIGGGIAAAVIPFEERSGEDNPRDMALDPSDQDVSGDLDETSISSILHDEVGLASEQPASQSFEPGGDRSPVSSLSQQDSTGALDTSADALIDPSLIAAIEEFLEASGDFGQSESERGDVIVGSQGADELTGTAGNDIMFGGAERSTTSYGQGWVMVSASSAYADAESDTVNAGDGDDHVYAGNGDLISSGAGHDTIVVPVSNEFELSVVVDYDVRDDALVLERFVDQDPESAEGAEITHTKTPFGSVVHVDGIPTVLLYKVHDLSEARIDVNTVSTKGKFIVL